MAFPLILFFWWRGRGVHSNKREVKKRNRRKFTE
jgi:hypothetical protein